MYILGLGGSDHSFSACLLSEKGIICAIEDERITREKHGLGPKSLYGSSRKYCLDYCGITIDDVDLIVGNDILHPMTYFPLRKKITLMNHHMAHAYSAYYSLPVDECAILIVDGTGSRISGNGEFAETISYGMGIKNEIIIKDCVIGKGWTKIDGNETLTENSIGDFYRKITEEIGFGYLQDGKTMGLAPYGTDKYYLEIKSYVKLLNAGQLEIKINHPEIHNFLQNILDRKDCDKDIFQTKADIAWAAQQVLEDCLVHCVDYLNKIFPSDTLCIAGGVGLNSVANAKIKEQFGYKHVYVPPYTSDSGTAIGSAYYGYNLMNGDRDAIKRDVYPSFLGKIYSGEYIEKSLKKVESVVSYQYANNVFEETAEALMDGKIIGWFQDESEMGPRALGHRSILVDSRNPQMKDILNHRVKKREFFRPFAPAILSEFATEFFEIDFHSPHMLFVVDVKKEEKSNIPSVTHVDGSARVQTVKLEENPKFYKLIEAFYKRTDIPVLLNTSFNVNGEPIVETPEDALNSFCTSEIDILVMGNWIINKR